MNDKVLILIAVCFIGLLFLLIVYMNNQSKKDLSKYAIANSALMLKNNQELNKASTKDWLVAGTSALNSASSIIETFNNKG